MHTEIARRFLAAALLLSIAAFGLSSCSDDGDPVDCTDCGEEPWYPEDYLTNPEWAMVIDCTFSSPHGPGMMVHIYPASQAAFYLDRDNRDLGFPVGTVILKSEYTTPGCSGPVAVISAMRKGEPGTAPGDGDWEWLEVDIANGTETVPGVDPACLACHNGGVTDCGPQYDYTCVIPPTP